MTDLHLLVTHINTLEGLSLNSSQYCGYLAKSLTLSSSIAVTRQGHGYHIEITGTQGAMLLFPVVTSAAYEAGVLTTNSERQSEKRRYYARLSVTLRRANLLRLINRLIDNPTPGLKLNQTEYTERRQRLESWPEQIESFTHCTFQIRGNTGQRQLEIGKADTDAAEFILLRECLKPGDFIVFLQKGAASYDVFGLTAEDMTDWTGNEYQVRVPDPGSSVVSVDNLGGVQAAAPETKAKTASYGAETERKISEVIEACERYGGHAIIALAGVPGTGKSFIASAASQRLVEDPSQVREIQFHQSFSYEEFIEGMRIGSNGEVIVKEGLFLEWNQKALDNPSKSYVLLIEELTRANISAVLGELMTYIEYRDRPFITLYNRRPVLVAKNLIILATYNPTDRSAIDIDVALLRRLRILRSPPSVEQLEEMLTGRNLRPEVITRLQNMFRTCQKQFQRDYEYLMPFGHGIFSDVIEERPDLYRLWVERIEHFLRRPLVDPHPFTDIIEASYPWRNSKYIEIDSTTVPAIESETAATLTDGDDTSVDN